MRDLSMAANRDHVRFLLAVVNRDVAELFSNSGSDINVDTQGF
jgi:hypothetical protein